MSSVSERPTAPGPASFRIASLDAFRGFVVLTMVFVNHLSPMQGVPAWMKHMPPDRTGMTFVDVVFPAFLFMVGMAIPPAFDRRLAQGVPAVRLLGHVLVRVASLLLIGVLMMNARDFSPESATLGKDLWSVLMYGGVILAWARFPESPRLRLVCRGIGPVWLVLAALVYRRADGSWLQTGWWGMLGLIGWAYLTASLCYLAFRRNADALMGCLGLLIVLYQAGRAGALSDLGPVLAYVNVPGVIGTRGSIVVAGVVAGVWITSPASDSVRRVRSLFGYGLGLLAAGLLLDRIPGHGFHKSDASDSWALASAGISCLTFLVFYALMDVRGRTAWADPLKPAGANALLAFLLPDLVVSVVNLAGGRGLWELAAEGIPGILRALAFAGAILALTGWMTKRGMMLKL